MTSSAPENHSIALLKEKCPRCHSGPVFKHAPYSIKFMQMYTICTYCGQDFEIEPGFYYGAMYVSYGITVFVGLILMIATNFLLNDPEVWVYLLILTLALLILSPVSFRYSRLIMLYMFGDVKYDPSLRK